MEPNLGLPSSQTDLPPQMAPTIAATSGISASSQEPVKTAPQLTINFTRSRSNHSVQRYDDDREASDPAPIQYSPPTARKTPWKDEVRERKYHKLAKACEESIDTVPEPGAKMPVLSISGSNKMDGSIRRSMSGTEFNTPVLKVLGITRKMSRGNLTTKPLDIYANRAADGEVLAENPTLKSEATSPTSSPEVTPQNSPKPQRKGVFSWVLGETDDKPATTTSVTESRGIFDSPRRWFDFSNFFGPQNCDRRHEVDGAVGTSVDQPENYPVPDRPQYFHQKEDHVFMKNVTSHALPKVNQTQTAPTKKMTLVNNSDLNAFAPGGSM